MSTWWLLITGAAAFGIAIWLRSLEGRVVIAALAVAIIAIVSTARARAGAQGLIASLLLAATLVTALNYQRRLTRIENNWDQYSTRVAEQGLVVLREAVQREVALLDSLAKAALTAPVDAPGAFQYLASLGPVAPYRGVVLADRAGAMAWAGTLRSPEAVETDVSGIQ